MGKLYFFQNTLVGGGKNKELLPVPENVSDTRLANNFQHSLKTKSMIYLCAHLDNNDEVTNHLPDIPYCKLDKFKEVTLTDIKDILSKAKKTHCERDPFSISDIKNQRNIVRLTGVFHKITLSLENGTFPKT